MGGFPGWRIKVVRSPILRLHTDNPCVFVDLGRVPRPPHYSLFDTWAGAPRVSPLPRTTQYESRMSYRSYDPVRLYGIFGYRLILPRNTESLPKNALHYSVDSEFSTQLLRCSPSTSFSLFYLTSSFGNSRESRETLDVRRGVRTSDPSTSSRPGPVQCLLEHIYRSPILKK